MPTEYYRYISEQREVDQLTEDRILESVGTSDPYTWFAPMRFEDPQDAKEKLALPNLPEHRIGPLYEVTMPSFDKGPRKVQANFGEPGGGVEVCTTREIRLQGLWDFANDEWEM